VSRPATDPPEDDALIGRLVREAGDPRVEPRPEHVDAVRSLLLDRLGPPRATRVPRTRRRWLAGSGLAAACLLGGLAWLARHDSPPVKGPGASPPGPRGTLKGPDERRPRDEAEIPPFRWPLQETAALTVSSPIPPSLFD
jgi:hypothetical protein